MNDQNCGTCRFSKPDEEPGWLECTAPIPVACLSYDVMPMRPGDGEDCKCYEPKADAANG